MKIQEILEFLDGMELAYTFQGDPLAQVERFSSLSHYCPGSFTWVKALKNVPEHFDLSALTLVFTRYGAGGCGQRDPHSREQAGVFQYHRAFLRRG